MLCDIHNHMIYGVDDGAQNRKMSYKMLKAAKAQKIKRIICTPHVTPGYGQLDFERYHRNLCEMQQMSEQHGFGIQLYSGCEIMYTESTLKCLRRGEAITLADTEYVLIEFMPNSPDTMLKHAALELSNAGYIPIFAHVERYHALRDIRKLRLLKEQCGVVAQMNASTVLASRGIFGNRWAKKVLKEGLIDIIASDTHNMSNRSNRLREAMDFITQKYGSVYSKYLRKCAKIV